MKSAAEWVEEQRELDKQPWPEPQLSDPRDECRICQLHRTGCPRHSCRNCGAEVPLSRQSWATPACEKCAP
jgi:hypothetical protein